MTILYNVHWSDEKGKPHVYACSDVRDAEFLMTFLHEGLALYSAHIKGRRSPTIDFYTQKEKEAGSG